MKCRSLVIITAEQSFLTYSIKSFLFHSVFALLALLSENDLFHSRLSTAIAILHLEICLSVFAETIDFFIIIFNSDESSLMRRKEQRIMLLTFISIYLYIFNRIFFQAENHPLTLSRSSSSYSVSVSLFKCFLSTAVMVFIAQRGLWGKLTSSFHLIEKEYC